VARRGLGLIKRELIDSINEAAEYEKAVKGLEAAFALTGRTMPGMANNLKRYGTELEKLGLEEDDVIIKAESLLLQLTNHDEKGIKAATRGAVGLASVFGMDVVSAAEMVAKGMEGNYLMLNRLIPAIRNATTEEGKRAEMMKTFESLYARAIADTETYAGQVKKLGLEWKSAKQALGESILETGVLQDLVAGLADGIKKLSGGTTREYKAALTDQVEANNRAGASLEKMAGAIGWATRDVSLLRVQYGLSSAQLAEWVKQNIFGTAASKALAKVLEDEAKAAAEANKGFSETGPIVAKVGEVTGKAAESFAEMTRRVVSFRTEAAKVVPFKVFGDTDIPKAVYHLTQLPPPLTKVKEILDAIGGKNPLFTLQLEAEKTKLKFEDLVRAADQIFSSFNAVSAQAQRNREIAVDNEYKKKLAAINANIKDETMRQKAIVALEAEYQIKRTDAQRAGAKAAKAVAMMEALVNTAAGVSRAFKDFAFPLSAIVAGIVGALGAVQVGLIAKQPIPLAKGAVFSRPTLLPATTYQVAEAGEPEIVSPKSTIRDAVREALASLTPQMAYAGAGAGAGVTINLNGPLVEAHGWSDNELRVGADKLVGYVNEGLRRLGRKQL
jgi:hypothetical protein